MPAFSGSLHSALEIFGDKRRLGGAAVEMTGVKTLAMNGGLVALRLR
jgi:hypothetical protein